MSGTIIDSQLCNLKAEENMFGAGEDSSEDEHMGSLCRCPRFEPPHCKGMSLVGGFMHILISS